MPHSLFYFSNLNSDTKSFFFLPAGGENMKIVKGRRRAASRTVSLRSTSAVHTEPLTREEKKKREIAKAKLDDLGTFVKSVIIQMPDYK